MAVPEDDHIGHMFFDDLLLRDAHLLDSRKLVAHEEGSFIDDGQTFVGEAHRVGIVVAAHGNDRRNIFEFPDQFLITDVARMDDAADIREEAQHLFVQLAMCI
ncbi:MAG: hypothetical protein QOH63_4029 [Acidobacteriota bacterium]|nr:hypothetical protein [Acidobacteriota bacterium]